MHDRSPRSMKLPRRTVLGSAGAWFTARVLAQATPASQTNEHEGHSPDHGTFVNAANFGTIADGEADDTDALQAAIDFAAVHNVRLLIPPGAYSVSRSVNIRTGSTISAHGATLITRIPDLGDPGTSFPTVRIYDAENVAIHGLEIDGRRDAFAHSQWKHGFGINNSRNVLLSQCHANRCKGDGVILEDKNIGDVNVDILVESCSFGQNYRMGGTASGALRAQFRNCVFWGTDGTQPMCGFDVEPDRPDVTCHDIAFYDCDFSDNGVIGSGEGYGFNVSFQPDATGRQSGVYLENCTMSRNGAAGVDLFRVPKDIELRDCDIRDNGQDGLRIFADATNVVVRRGSVVANGHHGIHGAAVPDAPCQRVLIDSVDIRDNGWRSDEPANGIHLNHEIRDIRVSGCMITGSRGYGLFVAPTVTNLDLSAIVFDGNVRGSTYPTMNQKEPDDSQSDASDRQ